jgi:hypothetical protein
MWHEDENVPVATLTTVREMVENVHVSVSAISSPVLGNIPAILEGVIVATAPGRQLCVTPATVIVTEAPDTAVEAATERVRVVPEIAVIPADRFPPETPAPATRTVSPTMNPPTLATVRLAEESPIVPVVMAHVHISADTPVVS